MPAIAGVLMRIFGLECIHTLPVEFKFIFGVLFLLLARKDTFWLAFHGIFLLVRFKSFKSSPFSRDRHQPINMQTEHTYEALIAAWQAAYPAKILSEDCRLVIFAAVPVRRNDNSPPDHTTHLPAENRDGHADLPPPRRFQRRHRSADKAPPGPSSQYDQSSFTVFSALGVDASVCEWDDGIHSNLELCMPVGPSAT